MTARLLLFSALTLLLAGCGGFGAASPGPSQGAAFQSGPPGYAAAAPQAPAAADSDLLRVGDVLSIRLSGVPPEDAGVYEVKVGDQGEISMPLLNGTFRAAGLTPSQLKEALEGAYRDRRVYSTPNITIVPELRYVNVSGEVRAPQRIAFTNDLTVLRAITAAGGFTDYANRHDVHLLRGGKLIHFEAVAAFKDPSLDIALQAGDQVQVPRSIF